MKKIKNRDAQALSWLSGHRTDISADSPLIGTDPSKGIRWRKSIYESSQQNQLKE